MSRDRQAERDAALAPLYAERAALQRRARLRGAYAGDADRLACVNRQIDEIESEER